MVIPPWILGISLSSYIVLVASDNIRSYECNPINALNPEFAAPVVALTNLIFTIGIIVAYTLGICKSVRAGMICTYET
jgi:hypothetical protein